MSYTAPTIAALRLKSGSMLEKIRSELYSIQAALSAIETGEALQKSDFVDITGSMVSSTSLAANGVDLAPAADATFYGVFVPPVDITVVKMYYYLTEAYVKKTTDAVIAVKTEADEPVTIFTRTMTAEGEAVRAFGSKIPETGAANIDAGTALNLCITATGNDTGTGHAKVWIEYIER